MDPSKIRPMELPNNQISEVPAPFQSNGITVGNVKDEDWGGRCNVSSGGESTPRGVFLS